MSSQPSQRVLVTGGAGFVGRHLVQRLEARGHAVTVFDLHSGGDICDAHAVERALPGHDTVVHLAAWADLYAARLDPVEAVRVNVLGTAVIAEAAARFGARLVHGSTACVYGNQPSYPSCEAAIPNPTEIYARSKLAAEEVVRGMVASHGLGATWARFPGVYGEGLRGALAVARFFEAASHDGVISVHGDGRQTRSPIYVSDLAEGLARLVETPAISGAINLGAPEEISALDLARRVIALTGRGRVAHVEQRLPQTWRELLNSQRAHEQLGWQANTSLQEGLARTWAWWCDTERSNTLGAHVARSA